MKDKELITAMENLALPDITQSIDNDIKKEVNKEVIDQTVDLLGDNIEIGLDVVIDNELLKEIPCIGNFIKAARLADTIHNRHLLIKLQEFVKAINCGKLEESVIKEHRKELEEHPKKTGKRDDKSYIDVGATERKKESTDSLENLHVLSERRAKSSEV